MDIYGLIIGTTGQFLALVNGTLSAWVDMPAGSSGPWDPAATVTSPGAALTDHLAAIAISASKILADLFETLF